MRTQLRCNAALSEVSDIWGKISTLISNFLPLPREGVTEFLRRASYLGMYLRPRRVDAHILTLTLATLSTQAAL